MRAPSEQELRRHLAIGSPDQLRHATTRSYLGDGRCVAWQAAGDHIVIDAELADRPPPPMLARTHGAEEFWERWTRAECAAKLAGVPIASWLRAQGLEVPHGFMDAITVRAGWLDPRLVVTVGCRAGRRLAS